MESNYPVRTHDLLPSEMRFLAAMRDLQFGRFERVQIEHGQLILDPWPAAIKGLKFGVSQPAAYPEECQLKRQISDFFQFVRSVESGEIRRLDIWNAAPVAAEIEHRAPREGDDRAE